MKNLSPQLNESLKCVSSLLFIHATLINDVALDGLGAKDFQIDIIELNFTNNRYWKQLQCSPWKAY